MAEKKTRRAGGLNPRENLFCYYMACCGDPEAAAVKAGYNAGTARDAAARLLLDGRIERGIKARRRSAVEGLGALAVRALERIVFSTHNDAIRLICSNEEISEDELAKLDFFTVSELKRQKGGGAEVRFFDKVKAAEVMAELIKATAACGDGEDSNGKAFLEALKKSAEAASATGGFSGEESGTGEV